MFVRVKLYGTLRRLSEPETPGYWSGEVSAGTTIRELLTALGAGKYEANAAAINGQPCELDDMIPDNAEITIVTPMGGG